MDQRRESLALWAAENILRLTGIEAGNQLEVVSGDASFRRYFRLRHQDRHWICVDAPADKEDNPRFVRIAQAWRSGGVHVPEVLATDYAQGFMLLEDFGDCLLWPALHADESSEATVAELYQRAIQELFSIQSLNGGDLPLYDRALLEQECNLFIDWLCCKQLELDLKADDRRVLESFREVLVAGALSQPQVAVHRDYHSRNLMLCDDGRIGVIDFQDAVKGPATYDLVSLLRDCYVRWPAHLVEELAVRYWKQARKLGIWPGDWEDFHRAFDFMGMQRHMKAAGIFARLNLRDGKPVYLDSIPNTCQYLRDVAGRYPELDEFVRWFDQRFAPALPGLNQ
ncbi:MAG: hypothetical protein CSH36_09635 [Thalassolituus sp.]|nr:MAG: hypothetical protein CSH36_09635 [Thalassolituus sp.]